MALEASAYEHTWSVLDELEARGVEATEITVRLARFVGESLAECEALIEAWMETTHET